MVGGINKSPIPIFPLLVLTLTLTLTLAQKVDIGTVSVEIGVLF